MGTNGRQLDLATIRARLAAASGQSWRQALEELNEVEGFAEWLQENFPRQAGAWDAGPEGVDRRRFLKLMGASLALAGLTGCDIRPPAGRIMPYAEQPPEIVLGEPLFFATAMTLGGYARGLLVESHEGRPTKVEGNMKHPASLGATDAFAQASVLTLCDPDRAKATTFLGEPRAYGDFLAEFRRALTKLGARQGAGLRILTETVTSPTLSHQLQSTLARFPQAVWRQYEAAGRDNSREGSRLSFGEYRDAIYRFDRAEVILSLDSDFLMFEPGSLRYAREFIAKRKLQGGVAAMSRLYVVEPTPSNTGAMADHRLPIKASEVEGFARCRAAARRAIRSGRRDTGRENPRRLC